MVVIRYVKRMDSLLYLQSSSYDAPCGKHIRPGLEYTNGFILQGCSMITFHDPRAQSATEVEAYELSFPLQEGGEGVTIGLLANGFPDSQNFLEQVGQAFTQRFSKVSTKLWNKGNASITAPQSMLDEIKASCQVAIAAYGH